jgi:hypothetical protein
MRVYMSPRDWDREDQREMVNAIVRSMRDTPRPRRRRDKPVRDLRVVNGKVVEYR